MNIPLSVAMAQATSEILVESGCRVFGGGRPDGRRPADAFDINCGLCEEWGEQVRRIYRDSTGRDDVAVLDPGNLTGDPDDSLLGHVFIRVGDRFYDAECPAGVLAWNLLPLFVRNGNSAP